ncbi:MAG TPA: hypothetical protein VNX68_12185 [Nitrosopumilaceae archaeon]|jgi:hypothetical protein|nr:hypothetical protein [Nitrosopumilaceae archaeon]
MRLILTIFFLHVFFHAVSAKGGSGAYYIKGIAFGTDKSKLINVEFTVRVAGKTKMVRTDDSGQFEIEVPWETACPSGITKKQYKRKTDRMNPTYIYLKYKDIEIKIKNEWEKYAQLFPESKEGVTQKKDAYFTLK